MPKLFDGEAAATDLALRLCQVYAPDCMDSAQALAETRAVLVCAEPIPPTSWRLAILNRALGRALGRAMRSWPFEHSHRWVKQLVAQARAQTCYKGRQEAKQVLRGVMETPTVCLGSITAMLDLFYDEPSAGTRTLKALLLEGRVEHAASQSGPSTVV